jgi:hypothetical protein
MPAAASRTKALTDPWLCAAGAGRLSVSCRLRRAGSGGVPVVPRPYTEGSTAMASIEISRPRGSITLAGAERAGGGSGMKRA